MARVKQLLVVLSCLALNSRFRELVDHNRSLAFSGHWTKRRELDSRLAHKLIESAEAFVFDLDGVIWIGGFLVEGVQETLEDLRGHGKSVIFATNNAMRTRSEVASRLKSLGLDWVMESDVFNSANAVARLLDAWNPCIYALAKKHVAFPKIDLFTLWARLVFEMKSRHLAIARRVDLTTQARA
eukprot:g14817.t1